MKTVLDPSGALHLEYVAFDVAEVAAQLVRERSGSATQLGTKSSPTDVVTHTDIECERLIRRELRSRCPGSNIVGEEFDDDVGQNNVGWIIDPIDGTVNFLYDLPVVSVSIAATIDDVVVAGAVADVHRSEIYSATSGAGARLAGRPIGTSGFGSLGQCLVGTGFAYDSALRSTQAQTLTRVLPRCRDVRCMGSAALNLCWVACGRLDAYFERDLNRYDYAAGALIAAEAGAVVELPPSNRDGLTIGATPGVFASLRGLVDT